MVRHSLKMVSLLRWCANPSKDGTMALQQTLPVPTTGTCTENAIVIEDDNTVDYGTPPYRDPESPVFTDSNYHTPPYSPTSPYSCSFASPCYCTEYCNSDPRLSPCYCPCHDNNSVQTTEDQPSSICVDEDQCDHVTCVVCMDRKRDCYHTECGHVCTCMECALKMQDERPYVGCGEECDCESHIKYICPLCKTLSTFLGKAFI